MVFARWAFVIDSNTAIVDLAIWKFKALELLNHKSFSEHTTSIRSNAGKRVNSVVTAANSPRELFRILLEAVELLVIIALLPTIDIEDSAIIEETSAFHLYFLGKGVRHLLDVLATACSKPDHFLIRFWFSWLLSHPVHSGSVFFWSREGSKSKSCS